MRVLFCLVAITVASSNNEEENRRHGEDAESRQLHQLVNRMHEAAKKVSHDGELADAQLRNFNQINFDGLGKTPSSLLEENQKHSDDDERRFQKLLNTMKESAKQVSKDGDAAKAQLKDFNAMSFDSIGKTSFLEEVEKDENAKNDFSYYPYEPHRFLTSFIQTGSIDGNDPLDKVKAGLVNFKRQMASIEAKFKRPFESSSFIETGKHGGWDGEHSHGNEDPANMVAVELRKFGSQIEQQTEALKMMDPVSFMETVSKEEPFGKVKTELEALQQKFNDFLPASLIETDSSLLQATNPFADAKEHIEDLAEKLKADAAKYKRPSSFVQTADKVKDPVEMAREELQKAEYSMKLDMHKLRSLPMPQFSSFIETMDKDPMAKVKVALERLEEKIKANNAKFASSSFIETGSTTLPAVFAKVKAEIAKFDKKYRADHDQMKSGRTASFLETDVDPFQKIKESLNRLKDKFHEDARKIKGELKAGNTKAPNATARSPTTKAGSKDTPTNTSAGSKDAPSSFVETKKKVASFDEIQAKLMALQTKIKADTEKFNVKPKASFVETSSATAADPNDSLTSVANAIDKLDKKIKKETEHFKEKPSSFIETDPFAKLKGQIDTISDKMKEDAAKFDTDAPSSFVQTGAVKEPDFDYSVDMEELQKKYKEDKLKFRQSMADATSFIETDLKTGPFAKANEEMEKAEEKIVSDTFGLGTASPSSFIEKGKLDKVHEELRKIQERLMADKEKYNVPPHYSTPSSFVETSDRVDQQVVKKQLREMQEEMKTNPERFMPSSFLETGGANGNFQLRSELEKLQQEMKSQPEKFMPSSFFEGDDAGSMSNVKAQLVKLQEEMKQSPESAIPSSFVQTKSYDQVSAELDKLQEKIKQDRERLKKSSIASH